MIGIDEFEREHRHGRFLKRNSPVYKVCEIKEYSFNNINSDGFIFPDNVKQNIVHVRYHEEKELDRTIKEPKEINESFDENTLPAAIIPHDFTSDWLEEQRKASKRSSRQFTDDDEFEMALEEEEEEEKEQKFAPKEQIDKSLSTDKKVSEDSHINNPTETTNNHLDISDSKTTNTTNTTTDETNQENEIDSKNHQLDSLKELQNPQIDAKNSLNISSQDVDNHIKQLDHHSQKDTGEQVPVSDTTITTDDSSRSDDAFEQGFTKGMDQAKKEANDLLYKQLSSLDNITNELNSKRKNLLAQAQNQFEQIITAISESIIEKELKSDKKSLMNLIERAVDSAIQEDDFLIYVSQDIADSLRSLVDNPLTKRLHVDENLNGINFRIESDQSAVESSIHDIIEDLMKKADLSLFEHDE